jgi:hypothetical protein
VDGLKTLDPKRTIREADILSLANVLNPSALQRREELLHRLQLAPYRGD